MNPSSTLRKISKGGRYCNTGITVPKASMKKLFNKGMESLSKSDSNTYGFVINDKGAYGKLGTEDKSRILTAYVRLKNGDSVKVWSIRNNRPESIPASLCLWFKNKKSWDCVYKLTMKNPITFSDMMNFHFHPIVQSAVLWKTKIMPYVSTLTTHPTISHGYKNTSLAPTLP